jgi:hypothetical protein
VLRYHVMMRSSVVKLNAVHLMLTESLRRAERVACMLHAA